MQTETTQQGERSETDLSPLASRLSPRIILIMAGGTGGHVMPGLAVAAEMRQRRWRVVWLRTAGSMEEELVARHGYPL